MQIHTKSIDVKRLRVAFPAFLVMVAVVAAALGVGLAGLFATSPARNSKPITHAVTARAATANPGSAGGATQTAATVVTIPSVNVPSGPPSPGTPTSYEMDVYAFDTSVPAFEVALVTEAAHPTETNMNALWAASVPTGEYALDAYESIQHSTWAGAPATLAGYVASDMEALNGDISALFGEAAVPTLQTSWTNDMRLLGYDANALRAALGLPAVQNGA